MPPLDACNRCNWRRCKMAGTTYHKRVEVGCSAPLMEAASTQASTAWDSKDCLDLLFVFLRPYFSRSSLVCHPSRTCTVSPISRSKRYRCALPTCTGLKAAFHFLPLPG